MKNKFFNLFSKSNKFNRKDNNELNLELHIKKENSYFLNSLYNDYKRDNILHTSSKSLKEEFEDCFNKVFLRILLIIIFTILSIINFHKYIN